MRALATLAVGLERSLAHDSLRASRVLMTRKRALLLTLDPGGVNAGGCRCRRPVFRAAWARRLRARRVSKPPHGRIAHLRRDVCVIARSSSRSSVDTLSIAASSIAPAPISWGLPRLHDRNGFETSARRKCCPIVSRKCMSLRRFRNQIRARVAPDRSAWRARGENNSALIFAVFTPPSVWPLMVF